MKINNEEAEIDILLTDSRNHFKPDSTLFFAIKTEGGNDGHKYIADLYKRGVRNFIVEKLPEEIPFEGVNFIVVPDTIEALTEVGKIHRNRAKKIVALTGSRGKTTLKEIIFQLLEPYRKISRSPRSFNSRIGVPLSLWQISADTDLAVIEAGISGRGQMQRMAELIGPDIVIFNNIGDAHSQGFSSMKEKAREKSKLAQYETVKTIIFPYDNKLISDEISFLRGSKQLIGWSETNPEADLYIKSIRINSESKRKIFYKYRNIEGNFVTNLSHDYSLENVAAALALIIEEGLNIEEIEHQFARLQDISTRLNVSDGINGCSVILDSYTSDLSSLLPAIDFMKRRKMPSQSLTLILSDLQHEVKDEKKMYKEIAALVEDTGINKFIGIGEMMTKNKSLFPLGSQFFKDTKTFLEKFSLSDFNEEIILLKGSPGYNFELIDRQLEIKTHETVLEVNLDSILSNYNYFRSKVPPQTGMIAMVKASGYGAGSYEIAKTLQDAGAAYLAVAALDEGLELRRKGIVMPIMIMNPKAANYRALFRHNLEPVVYSFSMLDILIEEAEKYGDEEYPVHLKLDTGMHRMGFEEKDIPELVKRLSGNTKVRVASVFSHLATADCLDMDAYTHRQLERFEKMTDYLKEGLRYKLKLHILNSAGILRFPEYHYDYVRLGIGLYGANTLPSFIEKPLAVVSTLRSVIICIREIEGDDAVGYARKGQITGKTRVATIPIGYADGLNRRLGNGSLKVWINGKMAPTIGNICMDATMIDVTGIECKEGDPVEIFGEKVSLQSLADSLDTIPYEILTWVSPRVKRIYYRE
ncbi:MAG: bifunctional UDP-N-acetylmuramoyl-tripeptide:D-alanyl-D-alanine ligase/alanine racemase [Muribaculaceae bacterium]|nr:bifunctional UDP-N-acetylmuramoyl-tripeptide:D-alanyl-D-alanine ligase/alanine racemase [Muribaculaceae bacterium]